MLMRMGYYLLFYIFFSVVSFTVISAANEKKSLKVAALDNIEKEILAEPSDNQTFLKRDNIMAFEEFSWGVRAFHNGYHNGALINFEKALAYTPKNALYRTWLGFASYYAGLEDSALAQWQTVLQQDPIAMWLQSHIDSILFRSSPYRDNLNRDVWAERGETEGRSGRVVRFTGPTSVAAHFSTGESYVASYGGNSVTILDVNGMIVARHMGGLVQFDGPWDIIPLEDGRFFVSEFHSKRISLMSQSGLRLKTFGFDIKEGGLTSPQYLALTEDGYLYVTDWASRRIVKYDFNGRFIMNIGLPSEKFEGIGHPAGITVSDNELYVVDAEEKLIRVFDHSGNYLYNLGKKGELKAPEGIRLYQGRYLIIADGTRIVLGNIKDRTFMPLHNFNEKNSKIMQTAFDANGILVVADNKANRVVYLTRLSSLYGGISVEIQRIIADAFPEVVLEVAVQSREGQSLRGLQASNFLLYENEMHVANLKLGSYDNQPNIPIQASLMIETSPQVIPMTNLFSDAIEELIKVMLNEGDLNTIFWASESPIEDAIFTGYDVDACEKKLEEFQSERWRFDAGLRMAASSLFPRKGKQVVFFVTTGHDNGLSYKQYQPNELATYLKNNGIMFFPIYVKRGVRNTFYDMIAKETGGHSIYLYRPQGLNGITQFIKNVPRGLYTVNFTSRQEDDFGRAYITSDLEVVVQKESGKAVSGYFPPLR